MGAAAYVGRVGGLAVALGVGSAVFTGHGVAWADETDSTPSKSPTSATSDSDTTDKADTADDAPEPEAEPDPDDEDDKDAVDPDDENAVDPDDEDAVDPDTEADPGTETDPDADTDPDTETDPDAEGEPEPDTEEPGEPADDTPSTPSRPTDTTRPPSKTATEKTATEKVTTEKTTAKADDPGVPPTKPKAVAVFADASTLAATTPMTVSPRVAALLSTPTPTPKPNLITAVVNVVNSMLDWAKQRAASDPGEAPQPPFLWALMSFARRELENLFVARTPATMARSAIAAPTSLALTADDAPIAAAAAAVVVPYAPFNPQVSPSTNFVSWVTGKYVYGLTEEQWTLANTLNRYSVHGTDVGVMWDNGMVDDPETPWDEHQVLIAVGDTFGAANMTGRWIYNTLFRSSDHDLSDGMTIPDGEWFNGNMFGGAPLSQPDEARPIINRPSWLPNSVTLIPTAGVSLPTEVTDETPFGTIQYVSFMSVSKWGSAGTVEHELLGDRILHRQRRELHRRARKSCATTRLSAATATFSSRRSSRATTATSTSTALRTAGRARRTCARRRRRHPQRVQVRVLQEGLLRLVRDHRGEVGQGQPVLGFSGHRQVRRSLRRQRNPATPSARCRSSTTST